MNAGRPFLWLSVTSIDVLEHLHDPLHAGYTLYQVRRTGRFRLGQQTHQVNDTVVGDDFDARTGNCVIGQHLRLDLGGQQRVVADGQQGDRVHHLQFVWTFLTRCTAEAACSAWALRSARGVWPASSTTPLKLVTTMRDAPLPRSVAALATLTSTLVSINESSILLPKVRVPLSSWMGVSRVAVIAVLQPLMPRHSAIANRLRRLTVILHSRTVGCRSDRTGSGSSAGGLPEYVR